jgi:hypothetical protein
MMFVVVSFATAEVRKDKDLPKSGSLSSTRMTGQVSNAVPEPFGVVDPSGKEISPITGSVSRINNDTWQMKVYNNSKVDSYSVDIEVIQRDDGGRVVKKDAYTYNLKPQSNNGRQISSGLNARQAELNLVKYKNVTRQSKSTTAAPTGQETKGQ